MCLTGGGAKLSDFGTFIFWLFGVIRPYYMEYNGISVSFSTPPHNVAPSKQNPAVFHLILSPLLSSQFSFSVLPFPIAHCLPSTRSGFFFLPNNTPATHNHKLSKIPSRFIGNGESGNIVVKTGSLLSDSVMGRNGNGSWFSSIKKTLSTSSKEKKSQKSEKKGFVEENPSIPGTSIVENVGGSCDSHPFPQPEEVKPIEVDDEPPPKSASSVAVATGAAVASTAVAANMTPYSGKSMAEEAAIRIQTTFRGYLARRVLWDLRGLVRLKAVVEGPSVKRQTANTLNRTQNASHVQSQINSRRIRMSEENQALQRQLLLKRAKELANLQNGDEWNYSVQSKEQMEAKLLSKYEATMRRERAMAYSFSHQQPWKKSAGPPNLLFMDPTNPQWGWSWSERYMAARPWEAQAEKDPGNDHASIKTGVTITRNEIAKSYARHQLNSAPSTPRSKAGGPLASRKIKAGPSPQAFVSGLEANLVDDDSQSVVSVRSERNRRHSVAGSMVKTDESLGGSPAARKHAVTKSAKAKAREKGLSENGGGSTAAASGGRTKKQLDFPGSPAKPRRHSGPPKVEANELK
ncbi:hypothetical protein L6452_24515 [Arctium lappa]|uniref:Uncharacterized protein n=1 Tax=Arctium lappa TaxID=4217 RepID=A0ACB9A932_ARCLA|nr:hypothetical protein L6452_24515 [Arctium lappa]